MSTHLGLKITWLDGSVSYETLADGYTKSCSECLPGKPDNNFCIYCRVIRGMKSEEAIDTICVQDHLGRAVFINACQVRQIKILTLELRPKAPTNPLNLEVNYDNPLN